VDGGLRSLGDCIGFEASLSTSGILGAEVVIRLPEALGVLATSEAMEVVLFKTL
jgi:hypothetical protein